MKLTYWRAACKNDSSSYDIRTKTKKECLKQLEFFKPWEFEKPEKIIIEFKDNFHLLDSCLGENGFQGLRINY